MRMNITKYAVGSLLALAVGIFFLSCSNKITNNHYSLPGWKLVWQDEFSYKGLPDDKKWGYEVGHIRNNEQQYYTKARKENVWVENGVLTITGRQEEYPNHAYKPGSEHWTQKTATAQFTSGSINTLGKASWKYGRVEIRARLPQGAGIWPALWMMGVNIREVGWPSCGEIDIMEFIGNKDPNTIYGTVHYKNNDGRHTSQGGKIAAEKPAGFNIYAIEWNREKIDIYFNDIKYYSFLIASVGGNENIFHKPFYLLINLALGGNWPGPVDGANLPQQYVIDYVRVYEKL